MNINNLLIIFIVLFLITLIYLIINLFKQKIETFAIETVTGVPILTINDDNNVKITKIPFENSTIIKRMETLEYTQPSGSGDSVVLQTSYIVNDNDYVLSTLKKNPPTQGTRLTSVDLYKANNKNGERLLNNGFVSTLSFYNYISLYFTNTNISILSIKLDYNEYEKRNNNDFNSADIPQYFDIILYTSLNDSQFSEVGRLTITNEPLTNGSFNINIKNSMIKPFLYIFISPIIKSITLRNINIDVEKVDRTSEQKSGPDVIKFATDNPSEQIIMPSTEFVEPDIIVSDLKKGDPTGNLFKLNNLCKLITPWAIYDGGQASSGKIPELLKRNCRDAIIKGSTPEIKTENGITYLSGSSQTTITFPDYSLPEYHTICIISKYTGNGEKGRILTCTNENTNWLLGHHGAVTGVYYNNQWKTTHTVPLNTDINEWVVSCVKSSSSKDKSLYFNKIQRNTISTGKVDNYDNNKKLTINTANYGQNSNFGLSYLFIWDVVLTDNQLEYVSGALNDYINKEGKIDLSGINVFEKDGSTPEKAANSAMDIKNLTCTERNGLYWIKCNGKVNQVYCIMDSIVFGGGWMLALKARKDSGVFSYYSGHWTEETTLNANNDMNYDAFDKDVKNDVYNHYKAKDCLAMFDGADTRGEFTFPNAREEYGWIWLQKNFYSGKLISLLEFFRNNNSYYAYTTSNQSNLQWVKDVMKAHGLNGTYVSQKDFDQFFVEVTDKKRSPLNRKIFSHQEEFKSWGLNIRPVGWNHKVRWGGSFNENPGHWDGLPWSNDVSCGIGLEARSNFSAGDAINCCQSTTGTNSGMGFKWFIR